MKQRALICLLLAFILAAYAFERLPFEGQGLNQIFAYSWIVFCALVIAGNGLALLKQSRRVMDLPTEKEERETMEKERQFG